MSQRTFLDACLGLLVLSVLLVPSSLAVGFDDVEDIEPVLAVTAATDVACTPHHFFQEAGKLAITELGFFELLGSATNGCGGGGCDDSIDGEFFSNGAWGHPVTVTEDGAWGTTSCKVHCHYQGTTHSFTGTLHGRINFTTANGRPAVKFDCGTDEDANGWEFGGWLYLDSDCEDSHGKPACN